MNVQIDDEKVATKLKHHFNMTDDSVISRLHRLANVL